MENNLGRVETEKGYGEPVGNSPAKTKKPEKNLRLIIR